MFVLPKGATQATRTPTKATGMRNFFKRIFILSIIGVVFYFAFGLFVVPPLGSLKDGSTVLYFRLGVQSPFLSSPRGILRNKNGDSHVFGRIVGLGKTGKQINDRTIAVFPYSGSLDRLADRLN